MSETPPAPATPLAQPRQRIRLSRRLLAGVLFALSYIGPSTNDLIHLLEYTAALDGRLVSWLRHTSPHMTYHLASPAIGLFLVTLVLTASLVLGPYRQGQRWAHWVLAGTGLLFIGAKVWTSLAMYPHWFEAVAPALVTWLAAVVLSRGAIRRTRATHLSTGVPRGGRLKFDG